MITIVTYTDNSLDSFLFDKCWEKLQESANGKKIITVTQKQIGRDNEIVVGNIGRSHNSLFKQILIGAKEADTKYIALAEHDCLYVPEHFDFIPPTDELFYYNVNHWLVQWGGEHSGLYSYYKRKVLSNLVCNRELLIEACEEKILMLEHSEGIRRGQPGACEFGVCDNREAFIAVKKEVCKDFGKEEKNYRAKEFRTTIPNLDIRHGSNFSGGRRARKRTFFLPYWGSFHSVLGVVPEGKWYQEAVIDDEKMPTERSNDTNEKRWKKFVEPFVQGSGYVTDLGCNAGFYCRKFAELGFRVTGVERNPKFLRHSSYWETKNPKGVNFVYSDIVNYTLHCSNYVLLANVHYWLTPEQFNGLIAQLREKAVNVIVIGRHHSAKEHNSPCDLTSLRESFAGWEASSVIDGSKHYSIMFTNPDLVVVDTEEIFPKQQLSRSRKFYPSYKKLINTGNAQDYMEYLAWRKFPNRESLLKKHKDVIATMPVGMKEPLTIVGDRITDGDHRLIVAKETGIKNLICKRGN